jgi:hypothetical protein
MVTPNEPEPVFRLISSSHSRIEPERARTELGEIFDTARRNNREIGVTGALVVADDWFAQTLEGQESVVRKLYDQIATDSRHERVKLRESAVGARSSRSGAAASR